MTDNERFINLEAFAQVGVGSIPVPVAEGVDGAGKAISPRLEDQLARVTARNMVELIVGQKRSISPELNLSGQA